MMVEFERVFQPFVDWLITDIPQDVTDAISKVVLKDGSGKNVASTQNSEKKAAAAAASLRSVALVMAERAFLIIATVLHVMYMVPCVLLYIGSAKVIFFKSYFQNFNVIQRYIFYQGIASSHGSLGNR